MIKRTKLTTFVLNVIITLVLCIGLVSIFSVNASAAETTTSDPYSGTMATSFTVGDGTEGSPYEIDTAEELYYFASLVNDGETGIHAKLTANIVVNENVLDTNGTLIGTPAYTWTPIGNSSNKYTGSFDGDNKTISGLYFNNSSTEYVGLFGYLYGNTQDYECIVKNVGVVNSYISGGNYVGGVVGYNYACFGGKSTVTNCYNTGVVTGEYYVGGVVGFNYSYRMDRGIKPIAGVANCYNTGYITGTNNVGGVVGENYARYLAYANITNCINEGNVTCTNNVGGVVGHNNAYDTNAEASVALCYNTGGVTGDNSVGGVAGYNNAQNGANSTIKNCYNTAKVDGLFNIGGVVGLNYSANYTADASVDSCYNIGTVKGNYGSQGVTRGYNIGAVVGIIQQSGAAYSKVSNCYYMDGCAEDGSSTIQNGIGNTTPGSTTADVSGSTNSKTADQFISGEVTYLLNGDQTTIVWYQTCGEGHPAFSGNQVYGGYTSCNDDAVMIYNNDKTAVSTEKPHTWSYEVDSDARTITASCENGCQTNVTITLVPEAYTVTYDGKEHGATVLDTDNNWVNASLMIPTIRYSKKQADTSLGESTTDKPKEAGEYQATITVNDESVSTTFTIKKKTITESDVTISATVATYNSREQKPTITIDGFVENIDYTISWNKDGFINAGDYIATINGIGSCEGEVKKTYVINPCIHKDTDGVELWSNGVCSFCGTEHTPHDWNNCICTVCGAECGHETYSNSFCTECGIEHTPHTYIDGFCFCGSYQAAVIITNENYEQYYLKADYVGYYAIGNVAQLMWFAQQINAENITTHKVILIADITIDESVVWTPINFADRSEYGSTFDGGGHTINIMQNYDIGTTDSVNYGLFSRYNYCTVENLILKGSIIVNTTGNVGAVSASSYRTTFKNIISYVDVINNCTTAGSVGGIVGYFGGQHDKGLYSKIENCAVYADVTGFYAGGLVGQSWNGTQYYDITNAAYVGNVNSYTKGAAGAIVGYQATDSNTCAFTNIYWCEDDGLNFYGKRDTTNQTYTNTTAKTDIQFASGEVAYLLGEAWGQTLTGDSKDEYPVFRTDSNTVYYGYLSCADDTTKVYTNNSAATIEKPEHKWTTPTYSWNEDYTECVATRTCGNDETHVESENGVVRNSTTNATCTENGKIVYTATFNNSVFEMQTFEDLIVSKGHNYDETTWGYKDVDGHSYTCTICGEKKEIIGHASSGAATEDTAESCTVCGYIISPELVHTHKASDEWKNNDTHHWHDCVANDSQEYDKVEHSYGEWTVTNQATETEKGSKTKTCECGHSITEEIPMIEKKGFSSGAITIIIIGISITLVGGGFAIYWFFIKKKRH